MPNNVVKNSWNRLGEWWRRGVTIHRGVTTVSPRWIPTWWITIHRGDTTKEKNITGDHWTPDHWLPRGDGDVVFSSSADAADDDEVKK